jgi:TIR domain-containing protein
MVVVWSQTSLKSEWVRHEAGRGMEQNALVPVMFDVKAPPEDFSHIQAIDLSRWDGNRQMTEIEALLRRLASLAPPSRIDTVRPGYDPLFLGSKRQVKLPGATGPVAVLRYLHFSVVMNPARRIAGAPGAGRCGDEPGRPRKQLEPAGRRWGRSGDPGAPPRSRTTQRERRPVSSHRQLIRCLSGCQRPHGPCQLRRLSPRQRRRQKLGCRVVEDDRASITRLHFHAGCVGTVCEISLQSDK